MMLEQSKVPPRNDQVGVNLEKGVQGVLVLSFSAQKSNEN
jgi:hypothetical protein